MTASTTPTGKRQRTFWTLRALETGLLISALVGMALFAWSIVDIVRIETTVAAKVVPAAATSASSREPTEGAVTAAVQELPVGAWPGVFLFFGSLLLLQPVRAILVRYRRDDGTQRGDARDEAAKATSAALASHDDDPGPVGETTAPQAEG